MVSVAAAARRAAAAHRETGDADADEDAIVAAVRGGRSADQRPDRLRAGSAVHAKSMRAAAIFAAALALLTPWPLLAFTQIPAQRIFAIQVGGFRRRAAAFQLDASRAGAHASLLKRRQAFRVAAEQFYIRGMTRTRHRAGVLIFVSLAEHYARIVADDGLDRQNLGSRMAGGGQRTDRSFARGPVTEGFLDAIKRTGDLLARAAPPDGGGNDLPDRTGRVN